MLQPKGWSSLRRGAGVPCERKVAIMPKDEPAPSNYMGKMIRFPISSESSRSQGLYEFLRVSSLIPEDQELITSTPGTSAGEALSILRRHDLDFLPIMDDGSLLGVFNYETFCDTIGHLRSGQKIFDIQVEECLSDLEVVLSTTEIDQALPKIQRDGAVLIGESRNILGIVTLNDALSYLWELSELFIMIRDIELSTRSLMLRACESEETLQECIVAVLGNQLRDGPPSNKANTRRVSDLTYGDLMTVLTNGEQYGRTFGRVFGKHRPLAAKTLQPVGDIRNKIVHFRDEVSMDERQVLKDAHRWLQRKVRMTR